ncbi:MAG: ATP-dependent zinc protease [Rhodothermales bacterium]|nr:ATP-dependent zinc protease [Rhodothermales bacterium]MBO6778610.1 ATP-dependent zinc protease [Rhodothermales bacterium]
MESMITVGWREYVGLPQLNLPAIRAKVDTGARTSALHAYRMEPFSREGAPWLRFWIHPLRKHRKVHVVAEAPLVDERVVSDSGGNRTTRPFIRTDLLINGQRWPIEVSLTRRDRMLFPMLLGRTAMEERLVVDPARSFVLGRQAGRAFRKQLLNPPS